MTMAWRRGLVFGVVLLAGGGGLAGTARAEEGVEKAVSIAVSFGAEQNDTVRAASGGVPGGDGTMTGLTAMASGGPIALGLTGELSSSVDGIANRTVGGLAGVRLPISPRLRVLALGEAGWRRFSDAPNFIFEDTVTPSDLSLPYVGGRVGLTVLVMKHLDLGFMAFARKDIGEDTMVVYKEGWLGGDSTSTTYQVGGFAAGAALQIGIRFDTTRPFNDPARRIPIPKT
jgi:hypothetical protein